MMRTTIQAVAMPNLFHRFLSSAFSTILLLDSFDTGAPSLWVMSKEYEKVPG